MSGAVRRLRPEGGFDTAPAAVRHFLDIKDFDPAVLRQMLDVSRGFKQAGGPSSRPLSGQTLAMIFEKPSTRTRVSFEVAMRQLGGDAVVLQGSEMQLGRGETVADTARVLSRYVDAIMLRTDDAAKLAELAEHATVPVINGLTNKSHPCQLMADVLTFEEHRGPIAGQVVAWIGDGNNVACSWIEAAVRFGFTLRIACPAELQPPTALVAWARAEGATIVVGDDPAAAVAGARCVVTDTWLSMSDDPNSNRHNMLAPYQVDGRLMSGAAPDALFMHCLPAHRGEEVTAEVIDGPQSVVFDGAENRLHAQKGCARLGAGRGAMNRSSLTEETPATPGWVDGRLQEIFAPYGETTRAARDAYAECLAGVRGAIDVDAGHDGCRRRLLGEVRELVPDAEALDRDLQALEAEISRSTCGAHYQAVTDLGHPSQAAGDGTLRGLGYMVTMPWPPGRGDSPVATAFT